MKRALTHIALHVANTDKSIQFYQGWCGMKVVHTRPSSQPGEKVVWLGSPDYEGLFVIVLLPGRTEKKAPPKSEEEHLGFAVSSAEEVRQMAERGKKEGILFWDYHEGDWPVGITSGVLDPDGNVVEFSYGQPIGFDRQDKVK